jgi:adenine-specific DNA-methyltransferase
MPTLDWIGKRAVLNHHREIPFHLLSPNDELSAGDPDVGNLVVQGDNLLALKALLPFYARQVKCVYIDPPYNTGAENWTYNDAVNSPEIREWLGKVVGDEAADLSRHDKWLCMMYPRLQLLKQFLREDGLIFVSIDDNEASRLGMLMDEIFGAGNHVETLIWKKSYGGGSKSKHFVNQHEYIFCYARSLDQIGALSLPPDEKVLRYYKFEDEHIATRGPYRLQPLATNSMDPRPNLRYAIPYEGEEVWPEKQWQWKRERAMAALANNELVFRRGRDGRWTVSYKQYLRDPEGEDRRQKPFSIIEGIYTQQGTNEIKGMFGDGKAFSFPKPRALIEHILRIATSADDVVLDSFAGSGTTGHAVLSLNKEDGGRRRFVLVELSESIATNLTLRRLRMAVDGYTPAGEEDGAPVQGLGGGYRYCHLGVPLLDETGAIQRGVRFDELAQHVYFAETGLPLPSAPNGNAPMLGVHEGTAVYLLYNGVLGDRRPQGGNVVTSSILSALPPHDGPKVIYAEGCRLGAARLEREQIVFKQTPYDVRVG